MQTSGTIGEDSTFDFTGQFSYDLAVLEPQLRSLLGPSVQASGKETRPFHFKGTLSDPSLLVGDASLGWQALSAYGFEVAANHVDARISHSTLTTTTVEAKFVTGGTVKLQPIIRLDQKTNDLSFAKGRIVDRATLTTASCADALGYALPALARTTKAEGTISFDLDDHRILLGEISRSTMKGKLTLHNVAVTAGPVISEVAVLFGVKQAKLTLAQDQTVAIRVENGRVFHDNLAFTMSGYTIATSGSVGFDGSLNLQVFVPLPESAVSSLLKGTPRIRDALANKTITVTITGTLTKPVLDRRAFQSAVQQFVKEVVRDAAVGKVDDLLRKGLEKLAPKKP